MGSAPKAQAYVWFAPSRDYFSPSRNPVGTVDVDKRALVTIKLRVKGETFCTTAKNPTFKECSESKEKHREEKSSPSTKFVLCRPRNGNEKVMFRPASFDKERHDKVIAVLALRSNTLLQLRRAVVCHNGEQRKLLLALVSCANFTCACSIGHSLKDVRARRTNENERHGGMAKGRSSAFTSAGPVGEVGGVRLPLQSLHGYGSVFMYSASTSPGGGGGQSSGGGGEVTLRLREPEDIPEEVLARLEDTATLSISLQSDAVLRLGAAGAGNGNLELFDSESGPDLTLSPQTFTSTAEAFINDNSDSLGVPGDNDTVRAETFFSQQSRLLIVPPYHQYASSWKGLRVSPSVTLFGTPQSQPRLVNIIAIRNVDVDDVTSASVIVNGGGDGEKAEEKR
ncbi:hypothetical protein ALC53_06412 [Atta colombica]|uniref:Uncharacterized protein n=1 Tax=Atta colombica TaxID=520822 RepID=A0A195BG53_9HYME|nr:hypothetical protein ALC53_06412 [Atta colombica]